MFAARHGKTECVQVLIDADADIAIVTTEGETALSWAEKYGHDEAAALLRAAADERRTVSGLEALRVGDSTSRRQCAHCGKTSAQAKAEGLKLRKCSACAQAARADIVPPRYCSRACQVAAWPEHKRVCQKTRAKHEMLRMAGMRYKTGFEYASQGRHQEALSELEEALRIQRATVGDDHPGVGRTRIGIGNVYFSQGRFAEAHEAFEEALRIARAKLGDDHPDVARTRIGMGNVYAVQGRYAEVLEAYEEALRIFRAKLGDNHPEMASTRNNIGNVYKIQGRFAKALEAYEEALRIFIAAFGEDHPRVVHVRREARDIRQLQERIHGQQSTEAAPSTSGSGTAARRSTQIQNAAVQYYSTDTVVRTTVVLPC